MKRLIILPNNIGDVIMATPLFEALKEKYPSDEVHFLVEKGYEGGVVNNPHIDTIHLFDRSKSAKNVRVDETFGLELAQLAAQIEFLDSLQFDFVYNLSQHPLYSALTALITASEKVGMVLSGEGIDILNGFWSRYLFAIPYARRVNKYHAIDVYKRIVGVGDSSVQPKIWLSDEEESTSREWLNSQGITDFSKLIVFQPGAAFQSKVWSAENYITLGKKLVSDGNHILITGAPLEQELCAAIGKEIGKEIGANVIVSAGKTSFRESIALASHGSVVISGDTALMHAASALSVPVIALFGSTSPIETGPYGEGNRVLVGLASNDKYEVLDLANSDSSVVNQISVESVYDAICGDFGHYQTTIDHGQYHLYTETGSNEQYVNEPEASILIALLNKEPVPALPDSIATELANFENRLSLAHLSLARFKDGVTTAYDEYGQHIQKMSEFTGICAFLTSMLHVGLNSISLIDMNRGVGEMLEVIQVYIDRIREVINDYLSTL